MIKEQYLRKIERVIKEFSTNKNYKFFIYGSSLKQDHFGDVDIGVLGGADKMEIAELKEIFCDSDLPYNFDVVDFEKVSPEFKNNVFKDQILWIVR